MPIAPTVDLQVWNSLGDWVAGQVGSQVPKKDAIAFARRVGYLYQDLRVGGANHSADLWKKTVEACYLAGAVNTKIVTSAPVGEAAVRAQNRARPYNDGKRAVQFWQRMGNKLSDLLAA